MPRRKTTLLTDGSPPAPNQTEETNCDSVRTVDRPSKRRKTSASSLTDHGSDTPADMDRKPRQTRSSGNSQPTSKKASILSRAATETSTTASATTTSTTTTTTAAAATVTTTVTAGHVDETAVVPTLTRPDQPVIENESHLPGSSVTVSQGHFVLLDSHKNITMSALLPNSSSELVQQHLLHQKQFPRSQSSSAPPALASDPDSDCKGVEIRDRRSTRSLEALFKVTDSELQNMREDVPTTATQNQVTTATGDQNYIFLNNLQIMDQMEGTQILITTSDMPMASMARLDGDCFTISVPSTSTVDDIPISYTSNCDDKGGLFKLDFYNESESPVQHLSTAGINQAAASTVVADHPETPQSVAQKEKTVSVPTLGRKRIHPQKPGKYKCNYCDRTCAKPSVLEKHLRAHTNERPFPCVVCGVSFKTKSNLSKHCKSNAHINRTGLSWSGSKDGPSGELRDEELKQEDEEDSDSEGTDTDVEGVLSLAHDSDNTDRNPKVIVESAESAVSGSAGQIYPGLTVRQESVLEGIRQKIENNNKKQQQEREGKSEMSKWFLRLFGAFDKPSESELAKYDVAETMVQENILTMDNVTKATDILNDLELMKKKCSQHSLSTLPVLMVQQFLSDDRMMVKILKPKVASSSDWIKLSPTSSSPVSPHDDKGQLSVSGESRYYVNSAGSRISCLSAPTLVRSTSSPAAPTETHLDAAAADSAGKDKERHRPKLKSHTNTLSVENLSFGSSTQRPRLLSQRNEASVGSLRSVFSQSSKDSIQSSKSIDESSFSGHKQFLTVDDGRNASSPSRHPSLGDSHTAAFSTIKDGKPVLVYQHALDSDNEKLLKYQGRSLSSSVTSDMVKDRIQKIISTNAEIIDKHTLTEPPRPKNKYMRQTSDSTFQTMKLSDLRPSSEFDRLSMEANSEKQWKKKLAASLSVGDTEGALLRPDLVQRSMSTSSLRHLKSDLSEASLINVTPQAVVLAPGPVATSSINLQVPGVTRGVTVPYQGEVMVVQGSQDHQMLLQQLQQQQQMKYSILATTSSATTQHHDIDTGRNVALPIPISLLHKAVNVSEQSSTSPSVDLTQGQVNSVQMPLLAAQFQALSKAHLVCVPASTLPRQPTSTDSNWKLKSSEEADTLEGKSRSPNTIGVLRFHSMQDTTPQIVRRVETSKSFSVTSSSFNSVSPSGGRVTIQDSLNSGLGNHPSKPQTQNISLSQTIPTSLPTKIVQGPGRNEIQIQFKLSQNGSDQPIGQIPTSSQAGTLQVPSVTQKRISETPSIISSMLQAPRQPSPMVGQPGVKFPARSKTDSPLLTSRSLSGPGSDSKVSMATLLQTGSLDSTISDSSITGKLKIGTSGSLHDQKKSMSRQGNASLSLPQTKQAAFMTELQQRLSAPQSEPSTNLELKRDSLSNTVSMTECDKLTIQTTEHFKSQGMCDGLAAAARAYLMTGPFTCEDCHQPFQQESMKVQHRLLHCLKGKGLRRSLSATEVAFSQGGENTTSALSSDHIPASGELFIISNPDQLRKTNPALFKSLSTTDLQSGQQSVTKEVQTLREQLVLVSTSSPSLLVTSTSTAVAKSHVPLTSSTSQPEGKQQKNQLIIENINPTQPRKKGRPKGSKNRPKDLNLVLAKARGAQMPSQAASAGTRQGITGSASLELPALKDPLTSGPVVSSQNQVVLLSGQYRKLLLPRAGTLPTQTAPGVADASSPCSLPSSGTSVINQLLTSTATSINIAMTSSNMIGQPMVPVSSKVVRQPSSGLTSAIFTKSSYPTSATKAGISVPLLELSPIVSLPGLSITGTNTVSVLSPSITNINPLTPGTPKSGGFMIGFPVSGIASSTPGTSITPVTTTNPLTGKTLRTQLQESSVQTSGPTKLASGPGLTLNIASAQSSSSTQFCQMSPRVIPFIPAVTFHNMDPSCKFGASLAVANPFLDQKSLQQPQIRMSQITPFTLTSGGTSTLGTPLTPATPDSSTDLTGTRRKLKDKLLMKQSLSVEKSQDKTQEKLLIVDSPSVTQSGFFLKTNVPDSVSTSASNPQMVLYQQGPKSNVIASNSALLASLTKPVMSSQKLGSLPNAIITSAVMGRVKETDKAVVDIYTRSESETYINPETSKVHPPVLRAFSEPAAKKLKKSKQLKPSPLSVEGKNTQPNSRLISRMLSAPKASQLTVPAGPEDLTSKKSLSFQPKIESAADSFDSGLSLRSLSQEMPFFFPKSASIASLDSNELLIDLSGDNFNNVTIPINYAIPFVNVCRLQSGPFLSEWNHPSRITGSQVNLSPLTLAGSKIQLPAVGGGSAMLHREQKNWLLKRSLSLHRHFQILSRLWHSSSPVTLDAMTAKALAQGNPSPALLGRALLSYSSSSSSSEALNTGTPGSADSNRMKIAPAYPPSLDSIDLTKEEPSQTVQNQQLGDCVTDEVSELKTSQQFQQGQHDKALQTTTQLKSKAMLNRSSSDTPSATPSSGDEPPHWHVVFSSNQSLQLLTPVKSASFGINITTSSLLSPSSMSSAMASSTETPVSSVTPSSTLNTPMYGHSCPTLYTTTHVTFCCIQRPQPMYVAVKGSKKISMYSNWRLATHNPNPVGLTSRMLLALYKSRNIPSPVYAQCSMTPGNGGNQTHSSYWTYHRKKLAGVKKEVPEVKNEGSKSSSTVKTEPGKDSRLHKLRLTKGGFKSNEKYEYIRGRGWGKYICEICGIRCKKPSMLKKHLRTHTDLRPYHCRHCRFSFKTKGNLTKHMKSKSHQKKCLELGIIPIPTSVDDSQIDPAALEEQCRISREARIHDSLDAQMASGEEDDDEDMDGEDEDGDEDEDEDDSMSRDDTDDQSFDQERSGSSSSRVLKRQSSIDEPSPVFSVGQGQKSRPLLGQMGSKSSRNREFSESSNVSYSSQSSMENRAFSPHNIDTEIARSLLDLSQPRRSESREIVDEDARRHALTHLQSLITQLMAQKKPLSGLNLEGDNTSPGTSLNANASKMMALSMGPSPGDEGFHKMPSLSSFSSLDTPGAGSSHTDLQRGDSTAGNDSVQRFQAGSSGSAISDEMAMISSGSVLSKYGGKRMEELYVVTDERHMRKGDLTKVCETSDQKEFVMSPSSKEAGGSRSSQPMPARPTQLSLLKAPASPTKQQSSNLPSPSLLAFLPSYVSSRYAQRGRHTRTSDQGPIIGQFVRKDSQSNNSSNIALTPNLFLASHSQPFQFNIPFPGQGVSSDGPDVDSTPTPSPVITGSKGIIHTIPIVTITDTSLESPSHNLDSPSSRFSGVEDGVNRTPASALPSASTFSSFRASSPSTHERNKTTSTMPSSSTTTPLVNISSVKPSVRPTLESHGRSNSESSTSIPKRRGSAIESLIRESAIPMLLVTGAEYSETNTNLISVPSPAQISSPSPNSQSDSCIDSIGYPAGRRSRRLSSGKSRFLRRQRSLADDTAFPSVGDDSVFDVAKPDSVFDVAKPDSVLDVAKPQGLGEYSMKGDKSKEVRETLGKCSEFVKSNSLQEQSHEMRSRDKGTTITNIAESAPDSPAAEKEKVLLPVKPSACTFCSENFHSVEAYTAHLQSRKHIGLLESLGMLPAGTYEKLQHSEQREIQRRTEEEKEKLEERAAHNEMKSSISENSNQTERNESVVNFHPKEKLNDIKIETEPGPAGMSAPNEDSINQQADRLKDNASPGRVAKNLTSPVKTQRFSSKRKVSHQPVTETATFLVTPHLNENLRQSLAKRARFGLSHSLTHSGESEADIDCPLVIDEPVKVQTSTTSAIVSLLASTKSYSGSTATTTTSMCDIMVYPSSATTVPSQSQMSPALSPVNNSNSMSDKPNRTSTEMSANLASPDIAHAAMDIDQEKLQNPIGQNPTGQNPIGQNPIGQNPIGAITKSSSHVPEHSQPSTTVQPPISMTLVQTTASSLSMPVTASHSYSTSSASQLQMPLISHAELRPYVCEFCDAGFTNERSLRTHLLTHGQDRPYICGNCGDTFAQWQDREVHYSSHSSTSIRQHQNTQQEMRIQSAQPVPLVSLAAHQSLIRQEDSSTISHMAGATFSTNQNAGITFSTNQNAGTTFSTNQNAGTTFSTNQSTGTTFSTNQKAGTRSMTNQNAGTTFVTNQNVGTTFAANQNVGTTFAANQNTGTTFLSNQNVGDVFLVSHNVVTSTTDASLSQAQKIQMLLPTVGKPVYSSSSNFSLNSNKPKVASLENAMEGNSTQNFEKQQAQPYFLAIDEQYRNTEAMKSSADINTQIQSQPVTKNSSSLNISYPENSLLAYVTTQPGMRQENVWNKVSNSKLDLEVEAPRENNYAENVRNFEMNTQNNTRILRENGREIENVRSEPVFPVRNCSEVNSRNEQKVDMAAESMTVRSDFSGQPIESRVAGGKMEVRVTVEHGQGDGETMELDQQQLKEQQGSQIGHDTFQYQLSQQDFPQQYFPSPAYVELHNYKHNFHASPIMSLQKYQLTQEGRTAHYGNSRAFDNVASNSTHTVPLTMEAQMNQNSTNWSQHSVGTNQDMLQFSMGHESAESSPSMCPGSIDHSTGSQESMVHQRGQYQGATTESNLAAAYKAGYSETPSHEESMEYQSGYNRDDTHGYIPSCQTDQQNCEEQNTNPILLPQTYYGLS